MSTLLHTAFAHHQAGRLDQAEPIYRQVLAEDPHNVDALQLLGVIATRRGDYQAAIDLINRAIAIAPLHPAFHYNVGFAYEQTGQLEPAITNYRRAVELKPDYAEAWNNLGLVLQAEKRITEALEAFTRAIELRPEYLEKNAHCRPYWLGIICYRLGWYDRAEAYLARAIEIGHNLPDAHASRSTLRLLRGDFERGWPEYEWRWLVGDFSERLFIHPPWRCEPQVDWAHRIAEIRAALSTQSADL